MSKKYAISIAISILTVIVLSLFFDVLGLISYGLIVLSIWLALAIVLIWCVSLILMKLRLIKGQFRLLNSLKLPLLLMLAGIAGVIVPNLYTPPAIPSSTLSINEQLDYMYETDQGDRLALRFLNLDQRDQERIQRVMKILKQGKTLSPENLFQAAAILEHGNKSEHYELAYSLAKQANETGYENELWKAAYDRWMLSLGNPQVYGTQSAATFTIFGVKVEQK